MGKFVFSLLMYLASFCTLAQSNARFSFDIAGRLIYNHNQDQIGSMTPIGFDYHNVLSSQQGDIGTLIMQLYATKIDNLTPHPGLFDDANDFKVVTRIFSFNYTGLGRNLPNIKIGHLELPYGSEFRIETNGTLKQYSHGINLGPKADWGISLNKQYEDYEYEVSLTTGGGQDFTNQNNSYILTGYIGNPSYHNLQFGFSFNKSKINRLERHSIALDVAYYFQLWGLLFELQSGKQADDTYQQAFLELNHSNSSNTLEAYSQLRYKSLAKTTRQDLIIGLSYHLTSQISLSAQFTRLLKQHNSQFMAQFRWRF